MDNLGDVRLFVEAPHLGGLSAAGRKLGLSPAAASARLFKLESVLHTRLFERTTRHLRLTDEGRTYLAYCQQALQALDDGHAFLQAGKSTVRGKVRISATSDFGRHAPEILPVVEHIGVRHVIQAVDGCLELEHQFRVADVLAQSIRQL